MDPIDFRLGSGITHSIIEVLFQLHIIINDDINDKGKTHEGIIKIRLRGNILDVIHSPLILWMF